MKLKLLRPVPLKFPISSGFGPRKVFGKEGFHNGTDFAVPSGTPVKAMLDGLCFRVGWENPLDVKQGFGLRVWQESTINGEIFYLWYGHLGDVFLTKNDKIVAGQTIAHSGNSGRSTAPHLHVQARKKDTGDYYEIEFEAQP